MVWLEWDGGDVIILHLQDNDDNEGHEEGESDVL